tara:strand:- start:3800 stop:4351 length:552 start_codon:yes stop_codon:yes gene_type:complete
MELCLRDNKIFLLLINIIVGGMLLYSYYYYIKYGGVSVKDLWGKAYPYRVVYGISMIVAAIGYIAVMVWTLVNATKSQNGLVSDLIIAQIVIIAVSLLWLPLTIMFAKSKTKPPDVMISIIIVLLIVAVASIQQVLIVNKLKPVGTKNKLLAAGHKAVIAGAVLFAIHTVFLDGLGWNIGFFS